jgi:mono/diheme cytochrome c family protein
MRPNERWAVLALICLTVWGGQSSAAAQAQAGSPRSAAPAESQERQQGRQVFVQFCAPCHGESGNGRPASGLTLKPPSLDLTAFELAPSLIQRVLKEGMPGTGMAAWNSLPADQLRAVTTYTASLARPDRLSSEGRVAPDAALREAGQRVYAAHCARCHGDEGKGDGPEATRYKPPPAAFTEIRPSYAAAAQTIKKGVEGTAMAAWPLLTRAEVQAVTFFIRSLYRGPEMPAAQGRARSADAMR